LDNFKKINTDLTESVVDEIVLPPLHQMLEAHAKHIGNAYAEGGDEFVFLLPNFSRRMAIAFAEDLRQSIADLRLSGPAAAIHLSASLGVAHVAHGADATSLKKRANEAKKFAKENGRNVVAVWCEGGSEIALGDGDRAPKSLSLPLPSTLESKGSIRSEYTALSIAARNLYEVSRRDGSLLATAAEQVSGSRGGRITVGAPEDVLDFVATHISRHISIVGTRAPSTLLEGIPAEEVRRSRFTGGAVVLRDVMYDKSIYWTDLAVKTSDLEARFDEIKTMSKPRMELEAEASFLQGSSPKSNEAKEAQLLLLAHLRDEGVRIRNEVPVSMADTELAAWSEKLIEWMTAVSTALKPLSAADSKWFETLDTVPPARVAIPTVRLSGGQERARYEAGFRQHDYRVARLDGLLQKYGVGVKT